MTYVAHYFRYGELVAEETDTIDEAVAFLALGWEAGQLSEKCVTDAEGKVILDGAPLFERMNTCLGA
ncbi:hypothetical protein [Streptomyces sp. NPDC086989]|uniref:hypothetical protein n=1 Tax=Streptomyces sp. NPDC086989 TaxID=3365764 RepID=UPI0037F4C93B